MGESFVDPAWVGYAGWAHRAPPSVRQRTDGRSSPADTFTPRGRTALARGGIDGSAPGSAGIDTARRTVALTEVKLSPPARA